MRYRVQPVVLLSFIFSIVVIPTVGMGDQHVRQSAQEAVLPLPGDLIHLCGLFFPTAFSPNGDGQNDVFKAKFNDAYLPEVSSFQVYNRAGVVVFETNDISRGWDGTTNGEIQPVGVYVWVCKGECTTGPFIEQGNVTLLR